MPAFRRIVTRDPENMLADKERCGFAAPEVVANRNTPSSDCADYSGPAADIWSSGMVLYAMLFGFYPFKGDPSIASESDALCEQIPKGEESYLFALGLCTGFSDQPRDLACKL